MSKVAAMRGLNNFISDIRSAPNKEAEQRRVEKELAKIREKFLDDKSLSGYDRRKYVWKLLYIYMLGYDIDFGHKQAADLIPQQKYKDKQVGYMACSLLLQENDEFLRLTMNAIHNDLTSRNEAFETLALSFIGNVSGSEMAEALTQDVVKLLSSGAARPVVKKRAALALLRLIRKTSAEQQVVTADTFSPVISTLLEERDLGLLLSVTTLLQGLCARNGPAGYEGAQPRLIKVLNRLSLEREREVPPEYLYYGIASPWLQCKCLRVLQFFPAPEGTSDRATLQTILTGIIDSVGTGDAAKGANPNKANALHAILFEAVSLALHMDTDAKLLPTCVASLGRFLSAKDANVRYLALETLARLSLVPDILDAIRQYQGTVTASLKDADVSIRKRAMDLLFTMCDASCAEALVAELLQYLVVADFSMREEVVLKIAILAEKFAPSVQWYVDTVLQLLEKAGDFVGEDIWHRVVQLVTNNAAMQQYAARRVVDVLRRGAAHESLVNTAAYLLGEFGRLVTSEVPPLEQFKLLHTLFPPASQATKGLLMTAYIKLYLLDPGNILLRGEVVGLFERYQKFMDAELQQRAVEYLRLAASPSASTAQYLLPMPKWQERESSLLRRLQQHEGVDTDTQGMANGAARRTALPSAISPGHSAALHDASAGPTSPGAMPRLIVGGPISDPYMAPQPSVDLLGADSVPSSAASGQPLMGVGASPSAAPPKSSNPVDLLADLLSDTVMSNPQPPAPAYGAAPGMAAPAGTHAFQPLGATPAPLPAAVNGGMVAPPVYTPQYTAPMGAAPTQFGAPAYQPQQTAPGYGMQAQPPMYAPPAQLQQQPQQSPQYPGVQQPPHAGVFGGVPYPPQSAGAAPAYPGMAPPALQPAGPPGYPAAIAPAPSGAAAMPPMGAAPEPAVPVAPLQQWYTNLLVKDRGIFYEDQYLQIGVQSRYARSSGQVVLFLGNKHAEASLTSLQLLLGAPPPGLALALGPVPAVLAPKQQVQVALQITATAPFTGPPSLLLAYTVGGSTPVRVELQLPVLAHKFVVPEAGIAKEHFFEQWKASSAPPYKCQEMVERAAPASISSVGVVTRLANLGVEHGYLDPSPYNEAGAGYFVYSTPAGEQTLLVMARIEGNPQNMAQFRVTVTSQAPQLSAQIKELLVTNLKLAPA